MDRLISEQAVIDRLSHWYSDMLETGKEQEDLIEVIKAIPSAEPCEDAISRQAVLDLPRIKSRNVWGEVIYESVDVEDVRQLPSVKPKTGHWEWVSYDYNPKLGDWHCSECRCVVVECVYKNEKRGIPLYKYCPQCGTKMVEEQESEK